MNSLVIKVGDLLRNPGRIDVVSCEGIRVDDINGLHTDGISASFALQGIAGGSVRVHIKNLDAIIHDVCDLSGEAYERGVSIKDKHITYNGQLTGDDLDDESLYDDTIPRDGVHETIDLQEAVRQLIYLDAPLIRIKPGNESILDQFDEGDDE